MINLFYKIIIVSIILTINILQANDIGTIKLLDPEVTINNGKSNYDLKIDTPKNINNIQPRLNINYSSQSNNDILGLDTTLTGISKITRCGEKPTFNNNDLFCLDKEPLVKIQDSSDTFILLNNPSIKFKKHLSDDYWEVFYPNGDVSIFGRNENSKILISYENKYYDSSNNNYKNETQTAIIFWNINETKDRHHNKVSYTYNIENEVPLIKEIDYGINKITFSYDNRTDSKQINIKYPKNTVLIHTDEKTNYKWKIKYPSNYPLLKKRLFNIEISQNNTLVYGYNFKYQYEDDNLITNPKSLLKTIHYYDSKNNTLNPIVLDYETYLDTTNKVIDNNQTKLQQLYLLSEIRNNFNVMKKIKYDFFDNNDILKDDNIYQVTSLQIDMQNDGLKLLNYSYTEHKYINEKHSYSSVNTTDSLTSINTTTIYSQDKESLNKPIRKIKKINTNILSDIKFKYNILTEENSNQKRVLLSSKILQEYSLQGNYISTTTTNYIYDKFDNIIKKEIIVSNDNTSYLNTQDITYLNDTQNWLINKPTKITSNKKLDNQNSLSLTTTYGYDTNGNLLSKTNAKDTTEEVTTNYEYNSRGLLTKTTIKDREISIKYDEFNRIVEQSNTLNQKELFSYSNTTCIYKPISSTDINNQTTTYQYDTLCEKIKIIEPNGRITNIVYNNTQEQIDLGIDYQDIGFDSLEGMKSIYTITETTNTGFWNKKYFNSFGEVIRIVKNNNDNKKIYQDIIYNKKGLKKAISKPYFKGKIIDNTNYIEYKYDMLNRVIEESEPKQNGKITTLYNYDKLTTIITKPSENIKTIITNIFGKPIKVMENDSIIIYKYNSNLNLIQTNTNGKIINMKYDILNRKIYLNDPSVGVIRYKYNKFNNIKEQTNNKNEKLLITYDNLGRIIQKNNEGKISIFEYDKASYGIGKLSYTSNNNTNITYKYDNYGRLLSKTKLINNQEFKTQYGYNSDNKITNTIYPSNLSIKKQYYNEDLLNKIVIQQKDIWDYDYLVLEKSFKDTVQKIEELETQSLQYEQTAKEYMQNAIRYKEYANTYQNKTTEYKDEIQTLKNIASDFEKKANDYQQYATKYKKLAHYYWKEFNEIPLMYYGTSNDNYYYGNYNYTDKYVALPTWMAENDKDYTPQAQKTKCTGCHCPYAYVEPPIANINIGDTYNKWSNYYQDKATTEQSKANTYKNQANDKQTLANENQTLANNYIQASVDYAQMAREEIDLIADLMSGLENHIKAKQQLQEAIDEKLNDDTDIYLYNVTSRDAFGRIEGELFGNGLLTLRTYDNITGKLKRISTGRGNNYIRDIQYTYDDMGNILTRKDNISLEDETFTYDEYDRLSSWNHNNNSQYYTYDIYGNLENNSYNTNMSYNHKNQIISKITKQNDTYNYSYDDNGNIINDGIKTYTYTSFNKIETITKNNKITSFEYDSFDNLVSKTEDNKSIYYIDKEYEYTRSFDIQTLKTTEEFKHNIYSDDKIVAVHTKTLINDTKQVDKTAYLHKDSLNSIDTVTNSHGEIILKNRYNPYGALLSSSNPNTQFKKEDLKGYTSHRQLYSLNLIDMGGRMYDPSISRFLSPDIFIQSPTNSQSFNRYIYVWNNPLKYTDPTGYRTNLGSVTVRSKGYRRHRSGSSSKQRKARLERQRLRQAQIEKARKEEAIREAKRRSDIEGISDTISQSTTLVGGFLQLYTGVKLVSSGLFGKVLGVGLIMHGSNNIYEGYTGKKGYLRSIYSSVFNENKYSYATVDIGLSTLALTRTVKERMVISGVVTTFDKVRSYQTMSRAALGFELLNNTNTIYGTQNND